MESNIAPEFRKCKHYLYLLFVVKENVNRRKIKALFVVHGNILLFCEYFLSVQPKFVLFTNRCRSFPTIPMTLTVLAQRFWIRD